jgi:hypothetical protein
MNFATNNGPAQMTLTTTGRIGINTLSPVSRLEVKGKTKITQQAGEDAALEISGAIKVSGTTPAAFVVTTGVQNVYTIDHPLSNGNPNAMVFVTHRQTPGNTFNGTVSVEYDDAIDKWKIRTTSPRFSNTIIPEDYELCSGVCYAEVPAILGSTNNLGNASFNVLIITN